ncbi:hypothetical protein Cgig2_029185 [Carnegiea gigantea]|uniref:Serine/threonine-protein phosphatase 4 regulatory subunit 3-like central domain-containing protein n=1 Tax=Carnegiea gigantea TaxID=171969 RepID=A0A9Q1QKJ5_9CARY|nr:hypothetical protein Cgig2_029185 [Carnegiea gigantea]
MVYIFVYNPEGSHVRHRDFLKEHVVFKEAIPIKDSMVLSKIHQTYRIGYLQVDFCMFHSWFFAVLYMSPKRILDYFDVIWLRALHDATVASLNSMIHANNGVVSSIFIEGRQYFHSRVVFEVEIVQHFSGIEEYLLQQESPDWAAASRDLVNEGLFDIISDILRIEDKRRDRYPYTSLESRSKPFAFFVLKGLSFSGFWYAVLKTYSSSWIFSHCALIKYYPIRSSNDISCFISCVVLQRDTIIEVFYERHLGQLIHVITSSCLGGGSSLVKRTVGNSIVKDTKPEILLNICELLCNFLLNNLLDKVLFLTHRREKYLVVAAVRFVRTLISRNFKGVTCAFSGPQLYQNDIFNHSLFA